MWMFQIQKTGKFYEAIGFLDGKGQGSFWYAATEAKLRKHLAAKYPEIEVVK